MDRPEAVARFLDQLRAQLDLGQSEGRRVVAEIAGHLEDDIAAEEAAGASADDATRRALSRIGTPHQIARQYRRARTALDHVVVLAIVATTIVAAWLLFVTTTVLPRVDPGSIAFWDTVAVGLLGYAFLTGLYLRYVHRSTLARWLVGAASVAAVGTGGYGAANMLTQAGDFEGYVVLIGGTIATHGSLVLVHEVARLRAWRRLAG